MKLKNLLALFLMTVTMLAMPLPLTADDNGDGTFSNPVIWADVPDPDVIRVGNYFYMVSTTMHLMPGAPVMRSKDLVNWETVSYLFDRLTDTPYDFLSIAAQRLSMAETRQVDERFVD